MMMSVADVWKVNNRLVWSGVSCVRVDYDEPHCVCFCFLTGTDRQRDEEKSLATREARVEL
jgi:hypothetical protein